MEEDSGFLAEEHHNYTVRLTIFPDNKSPPEDSPAGKFLDDKISRQTIQRKKKFPTNTK